MTPQRTRGSSCRNLYVELTVALSIVTGARSNSDPPGRQRSQHSHARATCQQSESLRAAGIHSSRATAGPCGVIPAHSSQNRHSRVRKQARGCPGLGLKGGLIRDAETVSVLTRVVTGS